jgi:hypothetical protein
MKNNYTMKSYRKLRAISVFATFAFAACGGNSSPPAQAPQPPPLAGQGEAVAPAIGPRIIKQGEFSLTLVANEDIRNIVEAPVHVISADKETSERLMKLTPAEYWKAPYQGRPVIAISFGMHASKEKTIRVPTIEANDYIILAVDLASPEGRDDRILRIPLKLDETDPSNPVARPLRVNLTRNGWQRDQ